MYAAVAVTSLSAPIISSRRGGNNRGRKDINFGGTRNGRTFDIKGFDSDDAVEIPLGNWGELSGQCANGIA